MVVFLLTPTIRQGALRYLIIDRRNHRKVHKKVVTKLGGIAIFAALFISLGVAFFLDYDFFSAYGRTIGIFFISASIILFLGIYDDIKGANATVKFSVQFIASLIVVKGGYLIETFNFGPLEIYLGILSVPFTVLFVLTMINAVNLIDGLDGLASGVVLIGAGGLFVIFYFIKHDLFLSLVSLLLAGGCAGFLKYNFYPAKIFMGDSGSLFLGFVLSFIAIYSVSGIEASGSKINMLSFLIIFAFPIVDTLFAFFRRIANKKHPFTADNSHLHHLIMKKMFTHLKTVKIIYVVTSLLTLVGIIVEIVFS